MVDKKSALLLAEVLLGRGYTHVPRTDGGLDIYNPSGDLVFSGTVDEAWAWIDGGCPPHGSNGNGGAK